MGTDLYMCWLGLTGQLRAEYRRQGLSEPRALFAPRPHPRNLIQSADGVQSVGSYSVTDPAMTPVSSPRSRS